MSKRKAATKTVTVFDFDETITWHHTAKRPDYYSADTNTKKGIEDYLFHGTKNIAAIATFHYDPEYVKTYIEKILGKTLTLLEDASETYEHHRISVYQVEGVTTPFLISTIPAEAYVLHLALLDKTGKNTQITDIINYLHDKHGINPSDSAIKFYDDSDNNYKHAKDLVLRYPNFQACHVTHDDTFKMDRQTVAYEGKIEDEYLKSSSSSNSDTGSESTEYEDVQDWYSGTKSAVSKTSENEESDINRFSGSDYSETRENRSFVPETSSDCGSEEKKEGEETVESAGDYLARFAPATKKIRESERSQILTRVKDVIRDYNEQNSGKKFSLFHGSRGKARANAFQIGLASVATSSMKAAILHFLKDEEMVLRGDKTNGNTYPKSFKTMLLRNFLDDDTLTAHDVSKKFTGYLNQLESSWKKELRPERTMFTSTKAM
ncbi:hypothetical protein [Legionella spiritensis]|uniref:hypothetical protein n=1 Tax=Legionella spiritensis TaxID=452 RepID=UPI000F6BD72B|nr:hypothetical protein [Legionella spiritensis]VEG91090.1 Uncharacterised protein [Legionella spiritensis]